MTWGPYYFFYICPRCGKKDRWSLDEMSSIQFSESPDCHIPGTLAGETKDIDQNVDVFADYEYI